MTPDEKKCPFCAETIKAEAIKCKHCKSDLLVPEPDEAPPGDAGVEKEKPEEPGKSEFLECPSCGKSFLITGKSECPNCGAGCTVEEYDDEIASDQLGLLSRPAGLMLGEASRKAGKSVVAGSGAAYSWTKRLAKRIAEWWKNPKFRKGTYITAGVVAAIIIALIVVAVVMHKSSEEMATSDAIAEAKWFLKYASDKDYKAMLTFLDKSSYPLLKAELCQALQNGTPADLLGMDDATFEKVLVDSCLPSLLQSYFWKSAPEVVVGGEIAGGTYAVILKKPGGSREGGTIIVKTQDNKSYSVDLSGMPMLLGGVNVSKDNRNAAEYITDSVNGLLVNPTKESCLTAIAWLASSKDLENKYVLLVSDSYRNLIEATKTKMDATKDFWEKAKNLAEKFPELAEKAEKEMDNFRTVDDFVTVTSPTEGQQFTVGQSAKAQGTVKIDCTITFNGQSVGVDSKTKQFAPVVTIVEGQNRLSFVITSKSGKTFNKDITVVGIPPAPPPPPPKPYNPPTMSLAEFNAIQSGMSYQQVCDIVGGPGTMMSESGSPGSEYYTVMYSWDGEGTLGANANCMFQSGGLVNKTQFGLE